MSSGWDLSIGASSGTGKKKTEFTSFPVGVTRIRVIDDAPYMRWTHWWVKAKRSINCPGFSCPVCKLRKAAKDAGEQAPHPMSRRYAINIINRETNRTEIIEQGVSFFEDLKDLRNDLLSREDKKDITDAELRVRRRGTGQDDTSYRIDIDVVQDLAASDLDKLNDKTDLAEYFKPHSPEQIQRLLDGESWEAVFSNAAHVAAEKPAEQEEEEIVLE